MQTIGIVAHSAEGAALCFQTACREGQAALGAHFHPHIVMSAVPMGPSLPAWKSGDHATVARYLTDGVEMVARAGADFYVCPDNTAHIVLEQIAERLPLPGLHIAEVVCGEIVARGFSRVGLLGTAWTMTGPVYASALARRGLECLVPEAGERSRVNAIIFDELCQGRVEAHSADALCRIIAGLKDRGADSVILGCTELPMAVTPENSPLPTLDSTRLLARYAVWEALAPRTDAPRVGWLAVPRPPGAGRPAPACLD